MPEEAPKPKQPTISFLNEDELQIHLLYRRRIVEEDTLINHRMTWLIASQAFLLAVWAVLLQRALDNHPGAFLFGSIVLAVLGILFAIGSLFSIKAAQDEIALLRANYLALFPSKDGPEKKAKTLPDTPWEWVKEVFATLKKHLSHRTLPYTHEPSELEDIRKHLTDNPLPGLTGSRNFHQMGHLVPKYLPAFIGCLWVVLLLAAVIAPHL